MPLNTIRKKPSTFLQEHAIKVRRSVLATATGRFELENSQMWASKRVSQLIGLHYEPIWNYHRPRKGRRHKGLTNSKRVEGATGSPGNNRVLQAVPERLRHWCRTVTPAHCKKYQLGMGWDHPKGPYKDEKKIDPCSSAGPLRSKQSLHPRHWR